MISWVFYGDIEVILVVKTVTRPKENRKRRTERIYHVWYPTLHTNSQ